MRLVSALERRGLSCTDRVAPGGPADRDLHGQAGRLPVAGQMSGSDEPSLTPVVKATGTTSTIATSAQAA